MHNYDRVFFYFAHCFLALDVLPPLKEEEAFLRVVARLTDNGSDH